MSVICMHPLLFSVLWVAVLLGVFSVIYFYATEFRLPLMPKLNPSGNITVFEQMPTWPSLAPMTQDTSLTEQGSHEPLNWNTVILPENMDPTKTDAWKVRALAETTTNPILDPIPLGPVRLREFAREMGCLLYTHLTLPTIY